MALKRFQFPKGFLWGAATASYQIEGATEADGRGVSVWDTFCATPGKIMDQSSGKDACRHYEKMEEDLDLMKSLNLGGYRFSIAWPRVLPQGIGQVNEKGLDFYERLVDGLLKRGIKPNATLFHWDLPQALEDKGGWLNRDLCHIFADYAHIVSKRLGDRCFMYATHNEPQVVMWCGYAEGVHAPGHKVNKQELSQVAHHLMLAHGKAITAMRANTKTAQLGIVLAPTPVWPQTSKPEDVAASEIHWEDTNDWWARPLLEGKYPEAAWKRRGLDVPKMEAGDLKEISAKIDFYGINYYAPARTQASAKESGYEGAPHPEGSDFQSMPGWEIFAPGLQNELVQFSRRYPKVPIYVTENGMSIAEDKVNGDGGCHDPRRLNYVKQHLIACQRAIEQGVDLRGYFVWSLMDNFEWARGYTQRFGIVHVDYESFKRTPKDSAKFYAQAALENGFEAEEPKLELSAFPQP